MSLAAVGGDHCNDLHLMLANLNDPSRSPLPTSDLQQFCGRLWNREGHEPWVFKPQIGLVWHEFWFMLQQAHISGGAGQGGAPQQIHAAPPQHSLPCLVSKENDRQPCFVSATHC